MKLVTYIRKAQFTNKVESHVGVKNDINSVYVDVYNPVSFNNDGTYWIMKGVSHTNAENIMEIQTNAK